MRERGEPAAGTLLRAPARDDGPAFRWAGRWRLYRQLLTEGLILSLAATAGGLMVANWCRNLMKLMFAPPAPGVIINLPAEMDWRVFTISIVVCLLATVLSGLVPAMQASRIDLAGSMRSESGGVLRGGRGKSWIRSGLVVVQASLSFILLVGAALLVKSLEALRDTYVGFSTNAVLFSSVDLVAAGYDGPRIRNFQDRLTVRVQSIPGVEGMVWSRSVPFSNRGFGSAVIGVDGLEVAQADQPVVEFNEVGPEYFAITGTGLVAGRDFTLADNDTALPVAVVNETMVERFWRGRNSVGQRLQVKGRWLQVVGVAKNSKYSNLVEQSKPFFYTPLRQGLAGGQNFQVRTGVGVKTIANAFVREVKAIDANLAPGEVITMREQVDRKTWSHRAAVTTHDISHYLSRAPNRKQADKFIVFRN